jgi:hypothetical protein
MTSLKSRYDLKKQKLHTFDDASGQGVAATVIAVSQQESGTSQGLVAIGQEKPNYTSPGTGFCNMGTNLVHNVQEVLVGFTVNQVFGWLDSTVALLWICRGGDFKQFVGNCVRKIQKRDTSNGTMSQPKKIRSTLETEVEKSVTQITSGGKAQSG